MDVIKTSDDYTDATIMHPSNTLTQHTPVKGGGKNGVEHHGSMPQVELVDETTNLLASIGNGVGLSRTSAARQSRTNALTTTRNGQKGMKSLFMQNDMKINSS